MIIIALRVICRTVVQFPCVASRPINAVQCFTRAHWTNGKAFANGAFGRRKHCTALKLQSAKDGSTGKQVGLCCASRTQQIRINFPVDDQRQLLSPTKPL